MPARIDPKPEQVAPPGRIGERIFVDSTFQLEGEPTGSAVEVTYAVQDHQSAQFQVTAGASRTETFQAGGNSRRHWFILAGPAGQNVVDMVCITKVVVSGSTRRRGFAITLDF
jgi:hypothetical protein